MIDASTYFYDLTGGKLAFHPVSIWTKSGQHFIGSMATISKTDVIVFCPMILVNTALGVRVAPYDMTTNEVFIPFDSSSFQSTAVLSKVWAKIWSKYAEDTCNAIPLTEYPSNDKTYFDVPGVNYMVQ